MPKVKVKASFIGTPKEVEEYGGQISTSMQKLEKRMTDAEKAMFKGKINPGTEMEVSEARASELLKLGLIEGDQQKELAKEKAAQPENKEKVMTTGPLPKAETKQVLPTAKGKGK